MAKQSDEKPWEMPFREWFDNKRELEGLLRHVSSSQVTPEIHGAMLALIAAIKASKG